MLDKTPVLDVDPFSTEFLSNPHPFHQQIRDAGPVVYIPKYDIYAMARFEEVNSTLRDWETFCSSAGGGLTNFNHVEPVRPQSIILEADPPLHTRTRGVLSKVLSRAALQRLRDDFQKKADKLIDQALEKGSIDGVKDLAEAFPLNVFPDAVGLQKEGRENLLPFANLCFNTFGPMNDILKASIAESEEATKWILAQCSRDALASEGFGAEIYAQADEGVITEDEAGMLVRALLTAGLDTTIYGITSALYSFAEHPDQWELLIQGDDALRARAFDEAVRYQSPVQTFFRTTTREVEVAGTIIPNDNKVLLFLGSANHDPRYWDEPDQFNIQRKAQRHVGFGSGIHVCVGQQLARLEADVVLTALAKKVKKISLVSDPTTRLNNTLRGLSSLPLKIYPQ
jgi:cytochrome P450